MPALFSCVMTELVAIIQAMTCMIQEKKKKKEEDSYPLKKEQFFKLNDGLA